MTCVEEMSLHLDFCTCATGESLGVELSVPGERVGVELEFSVPGESVGVELSSLAGEGDAELSSPEDIIGDGEDEGNEDDSAEDIILGEDNEDFAQCVAFKKKISKVSKVGGKV